MLNPKYVTAPSLQEYFVDKQSGFPLSGGKVFFYRDTNRTEPKSVYAISGSQANYTYSPLPNPVILSSVGTIQDNNGNDLIPYYYPYDENGNEDLYYIVVQDNMGVPQFTRQAWPNPSSSGNVTEDNMINYIPNGQLLSHTSVQDRLLVAGSNIIAQGGISIELPDPLLSTNTLTFNVQGFNPEPESPRYLMTFSCTSPNSLESFKILRVKFNDVNKFSTKDISYTFGFWGTANTTVPISIQAHKYYGIGGSPDIDIGAGSSSITTEPMFFTFVINFGTNAGQIIGDGNDDFVSIDILFPISIGFNVNLTDFTLVEGDVVLTGFPVQTNADMISRGVCGWLDIPDGDGGDLYLPPILTKYGMTFDISQIGEVGMSVGLIESPNSLPAPQHNRMPCDGSTYINSQRSSNGIPFSRLGNYLLSSNLSSNGLPLYGTGANFVSALANSSGSIPSGFNLTYNSSGSGSTNPSDGGAPTGFTFFNSIYYNNISTGTASIGFSAFNNIANTILCVLNSSTQFSGANNSGTSGFTFTTLSSTNGLTAQWNPAFTILVPPSPSLNTGAAGKYFSFTNASAQYFMWFQTGTETAPTPGGIGIQVNVSSTYTSQEVADSIRNAMNSLQSSLITIGSAPPANSFFLFSSNPSSTRNFFAWYNVTGSPRIPPIIGGATGIEIVIPSGASDMIVRNATIAAINSYQYQAPDFRGMFFRAADFNGMWDYDVLNRWSAVAGVHGAMPGTFEYQQLISHYHLPSGASFIIGSGGIGNTTTGSSIGSATTTALTGGSETRPINTYIIPFIRY